MPAENPKFTKGQTVVATVPVKLITVNLPGRVDHKFIAIVRAGPVCIDRAWPDDAVDEYYLEFKECISAPALRVPMAFDWIAENEIVALDEKFVANTLAR